MNVDVYIPYSNGGFYHQDSNDEGEPVYSKDPNILEGKHALSFSVNGFLSKVEGVSDASDIIKLYGINKPEIYDRDMSFIRKFNKTHNRISAFKKSFSDLGVNLGSLKIEHCIPEGLLQEFLSCRMDFLKLFVGYCSDKNLSYYNDYFKKAKYAVSQFQDIAFHKDKLSYAVSTNKSVEASTKNLFLRRGTDISAPMKVNLFGTRTGRISIDRGINILTLPKNHKDVLRSKFKNGKIYVLDYNAMEIRTTACLIEDYKTLEQDDIHCYFAEKIFGDIGSRDLLKKMFFPMFYGSSAKKVSEICNIPVLEASEAMDELGELFKYKKVLDLISVGKLNGKSYIKNCIGRPVFLDGDDASKHKLINYFIQSSASDLALQVLYDVVKYIEKEGLKSGVIYIHHDAIAIDVHPKEIEHLPKIIDIMENKNIFGVRFPVSSEVL